MDDGHGSSVRRRITVPETGVKLFYEVEEWEHVVDRSGHHVKSEGVTLSLSLVICSSESPIALEHISQTAAQLKKHAKAHKGSIYFYQAIG